MLKKQERLSFFSYLSFMLICHLVVFREVPLVPFSFLFFLGAYLGYWENCDKYFLLFVLLGCQCTNIKFVSF